MVARVFFVGACLGLVVACSDPVHDQQVASLGPENPGVSPGPTHRPGQPCLWCHGTEGPAKTVFSIGGTVYAAQGRPDPAPGAKVTLEDSQGTGTMITANAAGNFYVTPSLFQPVYPIGLMKVTPTCGPPSAMQTSSDREGSCAACHFLPAGPTSPGPIFITYAGSPAAPGCM